jgi:hypothetical protein
MVFDLNVFLVVLAIISRYYPKNIGHVLTDKGLRSVVLAL